MTSLKLSTANPTWFGTNKEEKSDFVLVNRILIKCTWWKRSEMDFGLKLLARVNNLLLWRVY